MKTCYKLTLVFIAVVMIVPEADAILGVRRRTAFRTAVVVSSATHAADASAASASSSATAQAQQQTAAAQQQTAAAQTQTAAAQQQAAEAQKQTVAATPAAAPAAAGKPLPIGTVVTTLPPGCVSTPVGGVEYYYGGGNFYRAVFQGNNLVYVTAEPK